MRPRAASDRVGAAAVAALLALSIWVGVASCSCAKRGPPIVLEYADVVDAGTPGAIALPSFDATKPAVHVLAPVRAQVASAGLLPYSLGRLGISFDLVPEAKPAFRAWTSARLDKPMALILDGRVVTVATIRSPLPGNGIIEFGEHGPSRSELWEIVERLEAKE